MDIHRSHITTEKKLSPVKNHWNFHHKQTRWWINLAVCIRTRVVQTKKFFHFSVTIIRLTSFSHVFHKFTLWFMDFLETFDDFSSFFDSFRILNNSGSKRSQKAYLIAFGLNSPSMPLWSAIFSLPSRRHVMFGWGEPVAAHLSVTLLPSLTTMSVLVG